MKRIRRRGWGWEYVAVRVYGEGQGGVIHAIVRGPFVSQKWLSEAWKEVHGAYIVDIRLIRSGTSDRVSNYCISQYVNHQEGKTRLSWSWGWVYRGFCNVWVYYKKLFGSSTLSLWKIHLRAYQHSLSEFDREPPPWHLGLDNNVFCTFGLPLWLKD